MKRRSERELLELRLKLIEILEKEDLSRADLIEVTERAQRLLDWESFLSSMDRPRPQLRIVWRGE